MKKVLASGFFDLLHSGHIAFLEQCAAYGALHVVVGSDVNIELLRGSRPLFTEDERLYMVQSVSFVKSACIARGEGITDFEEDLVKVKPDLFIVTSDGDYPDKRKMCDEYGVTYKVIERLPKEGLPSRQSGALKKEQQAPYRLCLAGGWMDQQFVNKFASGSCVTVQIEPTVEFKFRCGMATSTRVAWQKILPYRPYEHNYPELARLLFGYENPPGYRYLAGSQDAIGLTHPGVNRLDFNNDYWPHHIESCLDHDVCSWLEESLCVIPLFERPPGYNPLLEQHFSHDAIARLGQSGDACYEAIINKDIKAFGASLTSTHNAWREILPLTTSPEIDDILNSYNDKGYGRITSGCGGGYIYVATDQSLPNSFRIKVRR